jgi:hypothetical protein
MLNQVILKVQKYQFRSQMCLPLKNGYETSRCLVGDRWSNGESGSVIVVIVSVISLVIDDHIIQDDANTHDQIESALRITPGRND